MNVSEVVVDNKVRRLGRQIGKGGEGAVFALADDPSLAVKLYTVRDLAAREAKVSSMVRAGLAAQAPLVAFPLSIARKREGAFAGFVMKLVGGHKPLHEIYAPGPRKIHFPHADYRFLVRTATNVARAIASVHQSNCVIGDINHSGLLVSPKAVVALIDADSFQVSDGQQRFLCNVGVPEYTPPELQGSQLGKVERTANHDAFGLAVVVFQLLFMGRHPFVGSVRRGDIPPLHENIKNFRYVYAEKRDVGMDQPPGTPSVEDISPAIADLFERAFSRDTADRRPAAVQWIPRLEALEASLVICDENQLHYTPRDASECPWCEMERALGTYLFVPVAQDDGTLIPAADVGAASFNLDQVWARIATVTVPTRDQLLPRLSAQSPSPSLAAVSAKKPHAKFAPISIGAVVLSIIGFVAAPGLFLVWIVMFIWGMASARSEVKVDLTRFRRAFEAAEEVWQRELRAWQQRAGVDSLLHLRAELEAARDDYRKLGEDERKAIARYRDERRARQLHAYLDTFDIAHTKIGGIGPAKLATLASYGVDTAADVVSARLLSVPGFGPANSRSLFEWRRKLEARFVYRADDNDVDRQELARIRGANHAKAASLRQKLLGGAQSLQAAARYVGEFAARNDPVLERSNAAREQAKCDLNFLGVSVPTVPQRAHQVAAQPGTASSTVRSGAGSTSCPRCGGSMVRRLAKRGRNAGNYFWGCSRYPRCKGTRN